MPEPVRVLFFARNTIAHPSPGGMETSFAVMAEQLKLRGFELGLVTTAGWNHPTDFANLLDEVWVVPRTRVGRYSARWWWATGRRGPWLDWAPTVVIGVGDAGGSYAVGRHRASPFVIHCHGTPRMEAISALNAGGMKGLARAALNVARIPSRRRFFRAADEVWAVSQRVADEVRAFGLDPRKVVHLPNGVDLGEFTPSPEMVVALRSSYGLTQPDRVGLYLGRLDAQKGVDLAVGSLSSEEAPLDRLIVAGAGPEAKHVSKLATSLGCADRVLFLGQVDRRLARGLLAISDVVLLPTARQEGLPMVILEAAASGTPLVASRSAGVPPELLTGHNPIRILDKLDPAAIAAATAEVLALVGPRVSYLPLSLSTGAFGKDMSSRLLAILSASGA
jgi:glycosyltransferase involved in cell wall biosynthesis